VVGWKDICAGGRSFRGECGGCEGQDGEEGCEKLHACGASDSYALVTKSAVLSLAKTRRSLKFPNARAGLLPQIQGLNLRYHVVAPVNTTNGLGKTLIAIKHF